MDDEKLDNLMQEVIDKLAGAGHLVDEMTLIK